MEVYRRIGERIRHARLRTGLTQPQLASFLGVSKGIISRWETGLARPSLDRLDPLAQRLGITVEELLGFTIAEGRIPYRARTVPVWELARHALPDLRLASSIGQALVSEQEALAVQGAFYIRDDSLSPHFAAGDLVGVQTTGRPKLGDVLFLRREDQPLLRRYGGKRKGEVLLPLDIFQQTETVDRLDLLGIYRWLRRPGQVIPRG